MRKIIQIILPTLLFIWMSTTLYLLTSAVSPKQSDISAPHQEEIMYEKHKQQYPINSNYAPLVVGAGQGTTGTHLFVHSTCLLGFTSLHYRIGCIGRHSIHIKNNITSCPVPILFNSGYKKLVGYHKRLVKLSKIRYRRKRFILLKIVDDIISWGKDLLGYSQKMNAAKKKRDTILDLLEDIIVWGKENKVLLALHDTPYPLLMPEILRLTQKHYGESARPVILLSERDPGEWTDRRIQTHGFSSFCKDAVVMKKIDPVTLKGGAFDWISCLNAAISQQKLEKEVMYSFKDANRQHIVDTMRDYQAAVRRHAAFTYNMFKRENKTSPGELATMIAKSLYNQSLMTNVYDFEGAKHFSSSQEILELEFNKYTMNNDEDVLSKYMVTSSLVPVSFAKKVVLPDSFVGEVVCPN